MTATWTDTPALIERALAPVESDLRACARKLPLVIPLTVARAGDGHTVIAMPVDGVGQRGFTAEERCLLGAIAHVELPPLPAGIERIGLAHTITAAGAAPPPAEAAQADWRDPAATLAAFLDPGRRAALAACDHGHRTVRLILDLRGRVTRVWLPDWQFHSAGGDGSTPPRERRVRACLTSAIHDWRPPLLPHALGELEITVGP